MNTDMVTTAPAAHVPAARGPTSSPAARRVPASKRIVRAVTVACLLLAGCSASPSSPTSGTVAPTTVTPSPTNPGPTSPTSPSRAPSAPATPTAATGPTGPARAISWQAIGEAPGSQPLADAVSTPFGWVVTTAAGAVYDLADIDAPEPVELAFEVRRLEPDGDALVASGGPHAVVLRHDGDGWRPAEQLTVTFGDYDFAGLDLVVVGAEGAVGVTQLVGMVHADDARSFVAATPPRPFGDGATALPEALDGCRSDHVELGAIETLLAGEDGFVALVAERPDRVNLHPVCEPVLFTSSSGARWQRTGQPGALGTGAFVHAVASHDGHHLAAGGDAGGPRIWTSTDGLAWRPAATPQQADGEVLAVAGGSIGWVALLADPAGLQLWTSRDGVRWMRDDRAPTLETTDHPLVAVGPDSILLQAGTRLLLGRPG